MCRHSLIHRANTIDRWKLEFEPFSSGYRIPELFLRIGKSKSLFSPFIMKIRLYVDYWWSTNE